MPGAKKMEQKMQSFHDVLFTMRLFFTKKLEKKTILLAEEKNLEAYNGLESSLILLSSDT